MTYSNANFTPGLKGYSNVKPFRFWCQKVLPLVYDDSLSYYELLCKVVDYLNHVIDDLSATEDNVGELLDAYNQLQDYVNNYFTNLDVQEEINNKLDAMFYDGTIPTMIEEYVYPYIETLNEHYAELNNQINEIMDTQTENIANLTTRVNNLVINNTNNLTGYNVITVESTTAQGGNTITENIPVNGEILQVCYSGYNDTNNTIKSDNISYVSTPNVPTSTQQQVIVTITDSTDTRFNVFITYAISQDIEITELTDIRVGYDDILYSSAGDAVRGQISDLNSEIKNDLYNYVIITQESIEANRTVTTGTWGIIPTIEADSLIINPQFVDGSDNPVINGTYTISKYSLSGEDQTATFEYTRTYNINEPVTLKNVNQNNYFVIHSNDGILRYRYDSNQIIILKFSVLRNGKAQDYANGQISGTLTYKKYVPKESEKLFSGKSVVFFGDSRTWYDGHAYVPGSKTEWEGRICKGYQQTVSDVTGCTVITKGYSGYTSAQICNQIKQYDFTGIDAVYLSGGVNDFIKYDEITTGTLQPIGSEFDTNTSYGAWQSAIEYLLTNYPSLNIYIDTPWICWNWYGNPLPESIAEVKKNVAELYSIKCLDLYHESGINVLNRDYFYVDNISGNAQTRLHMNDYGNEWVGSIIGKFLLSY